MPFLSANYSRFVIVLLVMKDEISYQTKIPLLCFLELRMLTRLFFLVCRFFRYTFAVFRFVILYRLIDQLRSISIKKLVDLESCLPLKLLCLFDRYILGQRTLDCPNNVRIPIDLLLLRARSSKRSCNIMNDDF